MACLVKSSMPAMACTIANDLKSWRRSLAGSTSAACHRPVMRRSTIASTSALRCQKARRKRYGGRERRGTVPNQVSIEQRPAIVGAREWFGDWEADLVIGAGQQQALVTINERKSRSLIGHVTRKTAQAVSDAMVSLLMPFADLVHTLTTDNGKKFAQHECIASELGADFFFAHPYGSWERCANENMNGLIRQFFPKKMSFDSITPEEITFAVNKLNHRPRKCLGFRTPHEVFMAQLQSHQNVVALQG
jgi:IS30 family transposase